MEVLLPVSNGHICVIQVFTPNLGKIHVMIKNHDDKRNEIHTTSTILSLLKLFNMTNRYQQQILLHICFLCSQFLLVHQFLHIFLYHLQEVYLHHLLLLVNPLYFLTHPEPTLSGDRLNQLQRI